MSIHELIYLLKVREELREECVGAEVGEEMRWPDVGEEQRRRRGWGGAAPARGLGRSIAGAEVGEEPLQIRHALHGSGRHGRRAGLRHRHRYGRGREEGGGWREEEEGAEGRALPP